MPARRDSDYIAMTSPRNEPLAAVLMSYFLADVITALVVHRNFVDDILGGLITCNIASQGMLLMLWMGLGNAKMPLRVLGLLAWAGWAAVLVSPPREWNHELFSTVGFVLLGGAAPFGLLRVMGFRLIRRDALQDRFERRDQPPVFPPGQTRVQFSIVQILGWMALVAVMATLARLSGLEMDSSLVIQFAIYIAIVASLGGNTLWAVLGGERVGERLLAPGVVVFLITITFGAMIGVNAGTVAFYLFFGLTLTTALVASALALFRRAG